MDECLFCPFCGKGICQVELRDGDHNYWCPFCHKVFQVVVLTDLRGRVKKLESP